METITIRDVAKLCGVGVTTVSRAINNYPDISEATREKIMRVIRENHYVPNNSARNLKRTASKTVAVLVKGIANPFFSKMLQVFERETQKERYSCILQHVDENQDEIDVAAELEKEKRLCGLIFLGGQFSHSAEKLRRLTVPFVLSTTGIAEQTGRNRYSFVSVDDFHESYKMVRYLCRLGHKRIAVIAAGEGDESIGRLRLEGYRKALADCGIPPREALVRRMKETIATYTMENGYAVTKELLESGEDFTALYAISDSLAVGACRALTEAGRRVPADCSVAGFDGLDLSLYYNPSITTICQPMEEIAQESIRILFDLIHGKTACASKIFPAELVVRASTKSL